MVPPLVLLVSAGTAHAELAQNGGGWLMGFGQGSLERLSPKLERVRWWLDAQVRFRDDSDGFDQSLIRPGLGVALTDRVVFWAGYAWIRAYTSPIWYTPWAGGRVGAPAVEANSRESSVSHRPRSASSILLALGLAVSLMVACQTGPKTETVVEEGPGSVVVVQTTEVKATVTAIDATNRTVTLKRKWHQPKTFKVSEDAVNFQQVRVGDEVHAALIEEVAVTLVSGGAPPGVDAAVAVGLAAEGEKPAVLMADTVEVTATVVAIDGHEHTVTLEFADGRHEEVNVPRSRDLSNVGLGDSVRVRVTEALAISVVKP